MNFRCIILWSRLPLAAVISALLCCTACSADAARVPVPAPAKASYVLLQDLATTYGCSLQGPANRQILLLSKWNKITFTQDGREAHVNGTSVWLHEPMIVLRGKWAIRETDARSVIDPLIRPLRYMSTGGYRTVVIDPGHGGQDPGAQGPKGSEEKSMALDIARRLRVHLTKAGFQVFLTRDADRFIELEQRAERAKRLGADVFVSIHLNKAAGTDANGTETFTMTSAGFASTSGGQGAVAEIGNRFDALNTQLGYQVQRAITSEAQTADRGVRRARFVVLKHAPCPAVLIETGFVSNRREEIRFMTEDFRENLAVGIAKGIINYAQLVRMARREISPAVATAPKPATSPVATAPAVQPQMPAPLRAPAQAAPAAPAPVSPATPAPRAAERPRNVTILPTNPGPPK